MKNIKKLLVALALVLGINAFFLYPFLDSYLSMDLYINSAMTTTSIKPDGLYLRQLFGLVTIGRGESYPFGYEDEGHLNIGAGVLLCLVSALTYIVFAKIKGYELKNKKIILTLLGSGLLAAWISTVYFPWDAFAGNGMVDKLMSSVQYPWRYLMVQTVCYILVGVCALRGLERHFFKIFICFSIIAVACAGIFFYTLSWGNVTVYNEAADVDWADKLYLPADTDRDLLADTEIVIDDKYITLPVLAYNNLHVYDGDGNELAWSPGTNNCMTVRYEGKENLLSVKFIEPLAWRVSEAVTVVFAISIFLIKIKSL